MVHRPIFQTDLWNTYAVIFLVIDSFQDVTDFSRPPYSPDLNPPDYFLWGYLKERIYNNNLKTLEALMTW